MNTFNFFKFLNEYFVEACTNYNNTPRSDAEDKYYFEGKKNASQDIVEKLKEENLVAVPIEVLNNIVRYCENKAVFDKLGDFGDFYYKLNAILKENNQ